ncbi:protein nutcracker [Eupeodes corollae]|uniref:protein nutcracker n=1 Tax=Eupeodes corollae TaxID=290404 RepID=UPI0024915073|nr:protein nutcracker [Eupeodes corollae]
MDTSTNMQSQTAATSPSSPGAGNYNGTAPPGQDDSSQKMDAPQEDSKFKDSEEDARLNVDINMLTIEDSTLEKVPIHLENLLRSLDVEKSTPADLLFAIIYGVALECSFGAVNEVQKLSDHPILTSVSIQEPFQSKCVALLSTTMPSGIYDANSMSYNLRMQLYFDQTETHNLLMTGVVTGDLLILTLTPDCRNGDGAAVGKSICLSIGRYVLNAKGRPFPSRFRKLPELSYKLREQVLGPVRKQLIQRDGFVILYPCLEGLPEELYPYLYVYLNRNSLNKLANVSKRLLGTVSYYNVHRKGLLNRKK